MSSLDRPPPAAPRPLPTFEAPADWRAIDFIADLHLAEDTPRVFEAWAAHLQHAAADAVFILGDLFEVWIGDDVTERSFEARCVEVLRSASKRRVIGFMAGNRDFLVGDAMLESAGVMRLADPTLLIAFGERVLASHGDALCLDDAAYQRFRSVVRRPGLQRAFARLPRFARETVGRSLRAKSSRRGPGAGFLDVDAAAASRWADDGQAQVLVHGHTHAPASHDLAAGRLRHVLSDWELDDGSRAPRAEILRWSAAGFARIAPETDATQGGSASP